MDDHSLMREGLKRLLPVESFTVVGEAANGREALKLVEDAEFQVDIALIDYGLPDLNGIDLTVRLLESRPALRVIMILSAYDDSEIVTAAVQAKVRAIVKKTEPPRVLLDALQTVATGGYYLSSTAADRVMERVRMDSTGQEHARKIRELTPRELQVLRLIAAGKANKEVAQALELSDQTVKTHRKNVMRKLGVQNATQLVTVALQQRLIYLSGEWRD